MAVKQKQNIIINLEKDLAEVL